MTAMTLIETKVLEATATSIEFTSIPTDFTDIFFLCSFRANNAGETNDTTFLFNGSAPTGRILFGTGGGVGSSAAILAISSGNTTTANTFSNISLYIPNYTAETNKSFSVDSVFENNGTTGFGMIGAGLWSNTAAITTVRFTPASSASYMIGSSVSLYGVLKGSDGIVTTS